MPEKVVDFIFYQIRYVRLEERTLFQAVGLIQSHSNKIRPKTIKNDNSKETQSAHKDLHKTFIINVSSKAEFGSLGLDPSHLSFVLSSDGTGKKVNVDITTLPLVVFVI